MKHAEISGLGVGTPIADQLGEGEGAMLREFILAVAGSLLIVGCAADGAGDDVPIDTPRDDGKKSPSKSSSNDDVDDGHFTLPAEPSEPTTPTDPSTPPTDPGTPPTTPTTPPPGSQMSTCTASTGGHKSVTSIVFTLDNGVLKIDKMTVEMTNKDARNKNDIDVFITPSGGAETKSFNSGDILPNAKTTPVPLPSSFVVNAGAKVRVETNFDTSFSDPSASCIIQF